MLPAAGGGPVKVPGIAPASGTEATPFTLSLAAPNNTCPGDATTAGGGFRWSQYIVSASVDAATLTWNANGPVLPAGSPEGARAQALAGVSPVERSQPANQMRQGPARTVPVLEAKLSSPARRLRSASRREAT